MLGIFEDEPGAGLLVGHPKWSEMGMRIVAWHAHY